MRKIPESAGIAAKLDRRYRLAPLQHSQNPPGRDRGSYVFERVSAHNVANGEYVTVHSFEDFSDAINRKRDDEIGAACIARRIKREQQQQNRERTELHQRVETEVSVAA